MQGLLNFSYKQGTNKSIYASGVPFEKFHGGSGKLSSLKKQTERIYRILHAL